MHTRCTHCDTAFRITPEVLTYARGRVRCGQCLRTFDALEHLSEGAENVLIPATPEAQRGNPDVDDTPQDILEDEKDAFNAAQSSPESEYDTSELEKAAQDILDEKAEDTLDTGPASTGTGHNAPDMEIADIDAGQDTPEDEEDTFNSEFTYTETRSDTTQPGVATLDAGQDTPGNVEDTLNPEFASSESEYDASQPEEVAQDTSEERQDNFEAQQDPFAAEDVSSEVEEDTLSAEPASTETEIDAPEATDLDAGQDLLEDRENTAGDEQVTCGEEEDTFERQEVSLADEDDAPNGDLDLDATDSWRLDEELLNTSTLPALPGLVEHPEYADLQEPLPEPIVTAKPRPDMNWDDSWDDMSFDDEHGIPLMEDLEEIAETEDQATVITNHPVERIWFDPATVPTEADQPQSGVAFMRQGQASPEPLESAQAHLTEPIQEPTESDVAESVEPLESARAHLTEAIQDPIERDVAELVEAIEHAANMVTGTGGGWSEGSTANRVENVQGGISEAVPVADIAEVQAELERLALLVGMEPGAIAPDAAKQQAPENFEHIVRKRRGGWNMAATWLFSLLLAILFGAQLVHYHRTDLLSDATWGPLIRQTYDRLGTALPPDWELDRYDIRQLGGIQDPARPNVLVISISVRNQAKRAQPYPVIRLVLEDRWGDRLAMRDLKPADYLDSEPAPGAMMLAGQLIKADISIIEPEGAGATTFQVDACIENPGGHLDCANQL